tara:strand:- start:413 stop:577 length:165 start_codon:yes stop_codon:yes gene_type:complete
MSTTVQIVNSIKFLSKNLSFASIKLLYVFANGEDECIMSSGLELWAYPRTSLIS